MAKKRKGIPGVSFSWKRAIGLSAAKAKVSKSIGVPLTKQGRQRKMGKAAGCCIPAMMLGAGAAGAMIALAQLGGKLLA